MTTARAANALSEHRMQVGAVSLRISSYTCGTPLGAAIASKLVTGGTGREHGYPARTVAALVESGTGSTLQKPQTRTATVHAGNHTQSSGFTLSATWTLPGSAGNIWGTMAEQARQMSRQWYRTVDN